MGNPEPRSTLPPNPLRWKALVVCLTAGFMSLLNVSIVNVALPSIRVGLDATEAELQWIVSGYALSFGLVLVAAGRLGDARGRRTVFVLGVVLFAGSSVLAGLAPNASVLVIARLIQGVGSGFINPQISGLIQELFQGSERGRAFGTLGAVIGISTAIGPVLGGAIIALVGPEAGWRWIFLVNIPIGVLAIVLSYRYLPPPHRSRDSRDLDPVGILLLGGAVLAILWPLVNGGTMRPVELLWLAAGAALLWIFIRWERSYQSRGRAPMVDLDLFRLRSYSAGTILAFTYFSGFTGIFFILTLFFQNSVHYTALEAGLGLTSFAIGSTLSSWLSGRSVLRTGRKMVVWGLLLVLIGLLGTQASVFIVGTNPWVGWWMSIPLLVAGIGSGLVISPNQTLTLVEVPVARGGSAGGVLQTAQRMGTSLGIAIVGALYFGGSHQSPITAIVNGLWATIALTAVSLAVGIFDLRRRKPSRPTP